MPKSKRPVLSPESIDPLTAVAGWRGKLTNAFWPIAIGLFVIIVMIEADAGWASAVLQLLTSGLLLIAWLASAYGYGTLLRAAVRVTARDPLIRVTSLAAGLGLMSLLVLGLGLVGLLNQGVSHGLLGLGVIALGRSLYQRRATFKPSVSFEHWWWLAIVPIAALTITAAMLPAGFLWGADEPNGYDVVEYHLQAPREWFELGRIVPLTHNVFSFFPFNVEMHYLLAMHVLHSPWLAQFVCQMMHAAFIGLTVAAVYAAVADRGRFAAIIAALLAASVPWLPMLGSIAYDEGGLLLFGTLAIAWTLRAIADRPNTLASDEHLTPSPGIPREGRGEGSAASASELANEQNPHPTLSRNTGRGKLPRDLSIAGVMAGLACGCKLTAIPIILIGLPIAAIVTLVIHRRLTGRAIIGLATMFLTGLLVYSPWLIRNFSWVHNPVFPEMQSTLGRGYYNEAQSIRFDTAHKARPDQQAISARLAEFWRQVEGDWRFGYALLPIALIAMLVTIRRHDSLFLLFMLLGLTAFWLIFTHLQGRFYVLAIPIAAIAVGRGISEWRSTPAFAAAMTLVVALLAVGFGLEQSQFNQLNDSFAARTNVPLLQLIGFTGLDQSQEIVARMADPSQPLLLVGDAKVFLYQRPMALLGYRTVFDTAIPAANAVDAWRDERWNDRPVTGWIDPGEIDRLHKTYGTPDQMPLIKAYHNGPYGFELMPPAASTSPASRP